MGGKMLFSLAWLCAAMTGVTGSRAVEREEAKRYRLRWVREGGAESCVSGAALERLLDRVLEARNASHERAWLLEGVAEPAPPPLRYALKIAVRDPESGEVVGERTLTTADERCSVLTEALLLVLAMSVDPEVSHDGLPPSVTEELQRDPQATAAVGSAPTEPYQPAPMPRAAPSRPRATPSQAPITERPRPNEPRVFGAFEVSAGILPRLAAGASLGGSVPLRRGWSLSLALHGLLPQTVGLEPSAYLLDSGIQLAAGQLSTALCRPLFGDRLQLAACGGVGAGLRWVDARALGTRLNPLQPFFGPALGAECVFRVQSSWFVMAGVTAQVTLGQGRLTYQDHLRQTHVLYDPPPLSARSWLGLGAYL
jgi:hypothetical protein